MKKNNWGKFIINPVKDKSVVDFDKFNAEKKIKKGGRYEKDRG